jgi:hypothetical protein
VFKNLLFLLILIAGLVWLTKVQPVFATTNAAPLISLPLQPFTASAIESETYAAPQFNGDGVVFIDTSAGAPGVPYIAYETPKHSFAAKTLIFNFDTNEPCQVSAGELPCVRNINEEDGSTNDPSESDSSPIPAGTPIHLVGDVDNQAVIVDSYSQLSNAPTGMHFASIPFATTAMLSGGTTLTPISVTDNASCTLGVGCFGDGVQRLAVTLSSGSSSTNTEIVPGTIFMYNGSALILLSISGTGDQSVANFLVVNN